MEHGVEKTQCPMSKKNSVEMTESAKTCSLTFLGQQKAKDINFGADLLYLC